MNADKQETRKDKMEFGFVFGFIRVHPRSSVAIPPFSAFIRGHSESPFNPDRGRCGARVPIATLSPGTVFRGNAAGGPWTELWSARRVRPSLHSARPPGREPVRGWGRAYGGDGRWSRARSKPPCCRPGWRRG